MKHISAALAALALGVLIPGLARADQLGKKLNEEMPEVMKYLKSKGYKNVGVLRFQAQKGKNKPRFDNAPLNGSMATRLETLMVIHGGPKEADALGVIQDAGRAAAKQKVGSWHASAAQRKKLFEGNYPLAWGKKQVKANAFLTGLVKITPDHKKATVEIVCFDAKQPSTNRLVRRFDVPADRNLIREFGYSYALLPAQRKVLSRSLKRQGAQVDKFVVDAVQQGEGKSDGEEEKPDDKKPDDKNDNPAQPTPSNVSGVVVKMVVDGKDQEIRSAATEGDGPRWQVESPPPGKPVAITLKNTTDKRMGVVLKLNGVSTIDQQTESSENCRKWVIPAGQTYTVKGFYVFSSDKGDDGPKNDEEGDDKKGQKQQGQKGQKQNGQKQNGQKGQKPAVKTTLLPFKVLVGAEAKTVKDELGDKFGLIEIDVFAEGEVQENNDTLVVSAKGLPPAKEKSSRGSYKALRTALLKNAKLKTTLVAKREVIVPDKQAIQPTGPINVVDFTGYAVGHLVVKVVPKEDKPSD